MSTHLREGGFTAAGSSSFSPSSAPKRKRNDGPKFYAVRIGNKPGIYHSWADCLEQVKGYKNAAFKSFTSLSEAESFLKHGLTKEESSKFYGIQIGRVPGVYTDWDTARAQIKGWAKPKYRAFTTRAEAEAFVRDGTDPNGGSLKDEDTLELDSPTPTKGKPAAKKQKKMSNEITGMDGDLDESVEPGTGPLPPGAEDGFDSRIILNPETGLLNYKTEQQRNATKMQAIGPAEGSILHIWTDGSSLGNGGAKASAGVGVYFGPRDPRNVAEQLKGESQTNQRAELHAIQRAIEIAPRDRNIEIHSDSKYAIQCVTEWFTNWERNGWKSSTNKDVRNRDLVETIVTKIRERQSLGIQTKFHWVKGHSTDSGNIAADALAVKGARGGGI